MAKPMAMEGVSKDWPDTCMYSCQVTVSCPDSAGCAGMRSSTTGGTPASGNHFVEHFRTSSKVVALSSVEEEFCGI